MKARHILFGGIFFMLGVVFQSIINFLFPQGSFTKYSLLIMGGFILFSTLAYLWKSSILDSKPSAFIWIVSITIALSSYVFIYYQYLLWY
jgi:hypothetical protein